jgi:hypothetical protein
MDRIDRQQTLSLSAYVFMQTTFLIGFSPPHLIAFDVHWGCTDIHSFIHFIPPTSHQVHFNPMSSSDSIPPSVDGATSPSICPSITQPLHTHSIAQLLRQFQTVQGIRMETYSRFRTAFRTFMDERAEWEEQQVKSAAQRAKESTLLLKGGSTSVSAGSDSSDVTLADVHARADAAKKNEISPEISFQRVCMEVMATFQQVSKDVRSIIDTLLQRATSTTNTDDSSSTQSRHWCSLLQSLQQLEKLKLELTIHQQMLLNQHYVLLHPQQHGQVHEHHHHIHSVTDAHGRIRQHPSHTHTHAHGGLPSVCESGVEYDQELEDNAQPFTRHLSALLSDTAHATNSPFLFPPSGAAPPARTIDSLPAAPSTHGQQTVKLSAEQEEQHETEMLSLREQEHAVIGRINEILEEVREEVMEDAKEGEEDELVEEQTSKKQITEA